MVISSWYDFLYINRGIGFGTTVIDKSPNDELLKCKPKVVIRCVWLNKAYLTAGYFGVKRIRFVQKSSLSYSSDHIGNVRVIYRCDTNKSVSDIRMQRYYIYTIYAVSSR